MNLPTLETEADYHAALSFCAAQVLTNHNGRRFYFHGVFTATIKELEADTMMEALRLAWEASKHNYKTYLRKI